MSAGPYVGAGHAARGGARDLVAGGAWQMLLATS